MSRYLSSVVEIISGGTPNTSIREYWDGNIGWLSIVDFANTEKFVEKSEKNITIAGVQNSSTKILNVNDIIISARGTVGKLAMLKKPMAFNQSCFGLRAKDNILSQDYLFYYLKHFIKNIKAKSQGSVFDTINLSTFDMLEITYPDLAAQQKIAAILSALDAKIDCNKRINAQLEALAKTLYDYWFVQFDFPDAQGRPYKSSGGKMVYNSVLKREIPEGWGVKSVLNSFDVCYGYPLDAALFSDNKNLQPLVRIRDILDCSISAYTTEKVGKKYWLQNEDLIIGMDGNFHMNFWSGQPALLNQRCVRIRKATNVSLLQVYFCSAPYIKAREKNVSRTTVGHLSAKDIKCLYVIEAPELQQAEITECLDSLLASMCRNNSENQHLAHLRDWLLPMLMNGQVTVV